LWPYCRDGKLWPIRLERKERTAFECVGNRLRIKRKEWSHERVKRVGDEEWNGEREKKHWEWSGCHVMTSGPNKLKLETI
jgi:hypothetical protein